MKLCFVNTFVILQDVSDPEVAESDPCQSYVCDDGELYHTNKTESCDCPAVSVWLNPKLKF